MATTAFTSFLPEILPHVPGCSDIFAINALRNACIEFCKETKYWQETQDSFTVAAADLPYQLDAPSGANVYQILSMTVDGYPVNAVSLVELEKRVPNWRDHEASQAAGYFQISPNVFDIYPRPTGTWTIVLRVSYAPLRSATNIENYVYETQLEALAAGALWRLLDMPGQPWSNPQLAAEYRIKFKGAIQDCNIDANKTFSRANLAVQFRRIA